MAFTREIRTEDNRLIYREKDDRGSRVPIVQPRPANCRGIGSFTEVWRESLESARRGHLMLSANVEFDDTFAGSFLLLEVNVVGYVGAAGSVLFRTVLGGDFDPTPVEFWWDEPETYNAIALEARQNNSGQPAPTVLGVVRADLMVNGSYWR